MIKTTSDAAYNDTEESLREILLTSELPTTRNLKIKITQEQADTIKSNVIFGTKIAASILIPGINLFSWRPLSVESKQSSVASKRLF